MRIVNDKGMADPDVGLRRELDVGEIGAAIGRRKYWVIAPTLLCFLGAAIGVNMVKPRYTAEAKILVENQENFFTRPDRSDAVSQLPLPDDEAIQSQVQLMSSRDIARGAIRQLDLAGNSEFDPAASGLSGVNRALVLLGLERDPLRATAEDRLLSAYYDRLNVYSIPKSRVLDVQFTSIDPDLAAKAANTVADLYIDMQSSAKRDSAKAAASSLASLIAELKVKLAAADTKAQDFRASNGLLIGANNTSLTSQQLSDLTTQLSQARSSEADAESKAKLLREMIKQNRVADVPDVANNDLIRRISEQRIALKAQIAQQAQTLLPGHPHMRELNAQLSALESQLRAAGEKMARSLENDGHIAAGRIEFIKNAIEAQTQQANTAGTDQVRLNELEQQARLLRDQLDFNTQKYQEAVARENAVSAPADARVISRAVAPELPSFPKKLPMIAIFTLAGLILSLGMIIARELMSGRAFVGERSSRRREPMAPATAPVPVPAMQTPEPEEMLAAAPFATTVADADLVTMLDMVADHHRDGGGVRLLVARSAEAAIAVPDGALLLGRALARRSKVILVDCGAEEGLDRLLTALRPADAAPVRGLMNLLAGDTSFAEVIHRDPQSRLHVVPFGVGDATELDERFGVLIDALAETYEHVIMAVPQPKAGEPIEGALQADLAVMFVTAATEHEGVEADRLMLHEAGVPSVYVLDVADLGITPADVHHVAA